MCSFRHLPFIVVTYFGLMLKLAGCNGGAPIDRTREEATRQAQPIQIRHYLGDEVAEAERPVQPSVAAKWIDKI
jgi:hypothetical protein